MQQYNKRINNNKSRVRKIVLMKLVLHIQQKSSVEIIKTEENKKICNIGPK